jgi:hypothetical protein
MHTRKSFVLVALLVLVSMACSLSVNLPITTDVKTGNLVTEEIKISTPEDSNSPTKLVMNFGAGEMNLSAGGGTMLINGTATYNVSDLKPNITNTSEKVKIETGDLEINGIPNFDDRMKNEWDFDLGESPIDLTIKAGAYVGNFDIGGLALSSVHISDGASDVDVNFQEPNRILMETLRYETGASNISLRNLANANFDTMIFQSGAGDYELDFGGNLQRDATVFIESGLSSLRISVPDSTHVELEIEGGLASTTMRGTWIQSGNSYSIPGEGPTLKIIVEMNAGSLILDND